MAIVVADAERVGLIILRLQFDRPAVIDRDSAPTQCLDVFHGMNKQFLIRQIFGKRRFIVIPRLRFEGFLQDNAVFPQEFSQDFKWFVHL